MSKYAVLLGYFDKQMVVINRLSNELKNIDLSVEDKRYVFAMKTQQLYTSIEDLFKNIAKMFENHIQELSTFHKELLVRMSTEVPKIRPAVITKETSLFLDKLLKFRHFVRHAYDCELMESELMIIQSKIRNEFQSFKNDMEKFRLYIAQL